MEIEKKNISFLYEKNKDCKTFPISGAYGGPNPDNSGLIVHFYLEFPAIPYSTEVEIEKGNTIVDLKNSKNVSRGDYTREIQATTFMNAETAIVIGNWLIQNAEGLKARRKGEGLNP